MTLAPFARSRAALAAAVTALALLVAAVAVAEAKTLKLKGDDTTLAPDAETFGALTDAGFQIAPAGPAEARDDGSIAFPITRGRVNSKTLAGFIAHSGGLSITKGETTVTARRFVIRTDKKKPFLTARVGGGRLRLLELRSIEREDSGGKVIVTARATLAKPAAKALNSAFHTDVFKKGTAIGTATVTASA
jgi:hypothetical protein